MPVGAPQIVLEQLRQLPGGETLLELAAGREDVELVGGAVRDLLLERSPRELDVVADDAIGFAGALAHRVGSLAGENPDERFESTFHERFRTALVRWDGGRIDIATRRAESYPEPGALPDVRAGTSAEDLERRDFTINAIAVPLGGPNRGKLRAVPHALDDLAHRRLRVLHGRSFLEDPTRLLRLARYKARLGFEVEDRTAALAREAIATGALGTVSGARIGAELRLALAEDEAVASLTAMDDLGLLCALHPRLRLDRDVIERALALLPSDGRPDLLAMAALVLPLALSTDPRVEIVALLNRLEFTAPDRDCITAAATAVPRLIDELPGIERPSRLRAVVAGTPSEGIALAGGVRAPAADPAQRWLTEVRHVHLQITGDELLAVGILEGPEIGRRLERVLNLHLDGEIPADAQAQLAAALRCEH